MEEIKRKRKRLSKEQVSEQEINLELPNPTSSVLPSLPILIPQQIPSQTPLSNWPDPVQINQVIEDLPESEQPETYRMFHLLPTGARGTEYQLMAMMARLITLYFNKNIHDFTAVAEIDGFGNLDDIGLVITNVKGELSIESYQVKYYNHPIEIHDFFNQEADDDEENDNDNEDEGENENVNRKNQKMHVGKFFDGWLKWKDQHPDTADKNLFSILYSNAPLDTTLSKIVVNGRFKPEFINGQIKITISHDPKVTGKVHQNFLTKLQKVKITDYRSKKVWEALISNGFLDKNGCFTTLFTPTVPGFKLNLSQKALSKKVAEEDVILCLKELHDIYVQNQVDLYDLLYRQAWNYIAAQNSHSELVDLEENEKELLFRKFLESFRFSTNNSDLPTLKREIQNYLTKTLRKPSDQIFLCLFYAMYEWFLREYPGQQAPELTKSVMNGLLKKSEIRSRTVILLQGHTEALLSHISYSCEQRSVPRIESVSLKEKLEDKDGENHKVVLLGAATS